MSGKREATALSDRHDAQVALIKFLSAVARRAGAADHVYVVGGAVRDFVMGRPIKDVDVVVDAVALGRDSEWFAQQVVRSIPTSASYVTNQYGVAIITVKGPWVVDGHDLRGEVIEIANARKESYGKADDAGKGYKPTDVQPATIMEDVERREFTWNTLLWRMRDLADGPDRAEVIDLTGCGLRDLNEGVMRCPRDPDIVFSDDPTRMLRLVKFVGRYGFRVPPDVAASVRRNAAKMAQVPWEAIASLLVHDVIEKPYARRVLPLMRDLGLMDAIVGIVSRSQPFRTYLERELRGKPAHLVADLLSHGLQDPTPVKALSPDQRRRFVDMVSTMDEGQAEALSAALQKPPVDNNAIITEFALRPEQRGRIAPIARDALLDDPGLAFDPQGLTDAVRRALSGSRTAMDHIPGGRARGMSPSSFDPRELARGVTVEQEHTPDLAVAREIAMDHLTEIPDYYTRLDQMESEAGGKTAGDREVREVAGLRAFWEYNGPAERVYGVSRELEPVGSLVWAKAHRVWTVFFYVNGDTDRQVKLESFTANDDREGVMRGLLTLSRHLGLESRTAAAPKKYDHIDFKPPQGVADAAAKGLELRQKASPSNRGGFTPAQAAKEGIGSGVQRAVNLKNRDTISPDVIRQMAAFFARHEKNKDIPADKKGEPWNAKGYVAWLLWGGDPGRRWAEKVRDQMDAADEAAGRTAALTAAWGSTMVRTARTYTRIAMYDFDGTLFRSWEQTPSWWADQTPYSFFTRPESLDEPCVPDTPGNEYWINKAVEAAKEDTSRRDTLAVLVTGRVGVHADRIRELLAQRGLRFTKHYFNPGMSAARFKSVVLGNLLAGFNTVGEVVVWENENQSQYAQYLAAAKRALGRDDVRVKVHNIHEGAIPLQCGPSDFIGQARVAGMFDVGGPETPDRLRAEFAAALQAFQRDFDETMQSLDRYGETLETWASGGSWHHVTSAFMTFMTGRKMVDLASRLKQVPSQHRRMFDAARREFARTRKFDHMVWFAKNVKMLRDLYDIGSWPDIAAGAPDDGGAGAVTLIGSIRVVNQSDQDPAKSVDLVRRAARALSDSGVPGITRVLYGDVFVVGDIARKRSVAAWYVRDKDVIEVMAVKRFAESQLRVTVHEFGHRYWQKFMAPDVKRAWTRHHDDMSSASPDYDFPKVGDVLDYVVGSPKVLDFAPSTNGYLVQTSNGSTGTIYKHQLVGVLRDRAVRATFPTPYAAKNAEEHFCEALSLFCLGDLKGSNLAAFRTIVLGETPEKAELSLTASWGPVPRRR